MLQNHITLVAILFIVINFSYKNFIHLLHKTLVFFIKFALYLRFAPNKKHARMDEKKVVDLIYRLLVGTMGLHGF